jgi:hypothetical protein
VATATRNRTRHMQKKAYWLDICRRYMVKGADLGGDGQDMPFEQAFSNLAHAYLKDKAPGLLDHEVGFQLVDRNEDNSKAVGIFGFKVGSQWLYAPVFFINGDLKGHELLYIKNQDAFVPLKENWINYLLNKKPLSLGSGVDKDTRRLGVRAPDFSRIVHSPSSSKSAAAPSGFRPQPWLADAMPGLAYALTTDPYRDPRYASVATLPDVIKVAGVGGVAYIKGLLDVHPTLMEAVERFYGDSLLDAVAAVKEAAARSRAEERSILTPPVRRPVRPAVAGRLLDRAPAEKRGAVQVINYDPGRTDRLKALTDDDRQALIRDGYRVIDRRRDEETSRVYRGDVPATTSRNLTNPTDTGLYDALIKPGEFAKCLVVIGPHGPIGRAGFATVIKAEDAAADRGWVNIHPSYVWVAKQYGDEEFQAWLEKVGDPSADGAPTEEGKQFILVGPNGSGTLPFIVEGEMGDNELSWKTYKVRFDLFSDKPRPAYSLGQSNQKWIALQLAKNGEDFDRWDDGERIHLDGKRGTKLVSAKGDVYVPKELFLVEVEPAEYEDEQWKAPEFEPESFKRGVMSLTGGQGKSKTAPLTHMTGNVDADLGVYRKTAALEVRFDGASGYVNGGRYLTRNRLLADLVVNHGLREKVARQIMDECEEGRYKIGGAVRRYRIAYPGLEKGAAAGDYGGAGMAGMGPSAPGFPDPAYGIDATMGSGVQALGPQEDAVGVPGMQADPSAAASQMPMGPDPRAVRVADQAAATGQREIFDTAAVGGLLKTTRDDQLDRFLGDLMKGLDRIGRILFLLNWHKEQFEEKYGKTEIPELVDSVRNAFEDVGDLVLFLKQKSIEPDPQADTQRIDLKDNAS